MSKRVLGCGGVAIVGVVARENYCKTNHTTYDLPDYVSIKTYHKYNIVQLSSIYANTMCVRYYNHREDGTLCKFIRDSETPENDICNALALIKHNK